jgi:3-oxoadipate enol-lactonase
MPFAQLSDCKIHYSLDGLENKNVPTLVFSNSLGTTLNMWDAQIPTLAKQFCILRYDTRGHGQSSVTPGPYSIAQLARDLLGLLDHLELHRVYFCGLSMGGMTGMWLAANAPERLHKLVISNSAAKIGTAEFWRARIDAVQKGGMASVASAVIERWFTSAFCQQNPAAIAPVRTMLERANPEGYVANCAAVRDFDFRENLTSIQAPALVISGAHDPAATPADGQFLAQNIPGARYLELPASHLSNIESPAQFTTALQAFLTS